MTETALPQLSHARRVVIKIGSALIVDPQQAAPRQPWLDSVAQDIAALRAQGTEVVVVSSGAIALARHQLGLTRPVLRLEEKQAAASVGQIRLAQAWTDALSRFDITAAQLLLTPDDTENRNRYLNARASLNTLLSLGCVPIINENDAIATTEIRFGDNDRLGARVAEMINADQLVLLSDIDGLHRRPPHQPRCPAPARNRGTDRQHRGHGGRPRRAIHRVACAPSSWQHASPPRRAAPWPLQKARACTRLPTCVMAGAARGSCPHPMPARHARTGLRAA